MAVITKYVVERNGVEKMTFTSKAEADAYDKMLDTADALQLLLQDSALIADEQQTETLALYLAQQKDAVLIALGAKKAPAKTAEKEPKVSEKSQLNTAELTAVKKSSKTEQAA
ncbi:YebG family protein [Alishewanella sp. 16-MA]|uniref:YebG family protein n=1 Tax=Alishewanella maricola TaxID=2795740 RepID=A0ABS8C3I6_9ALTE|nr:MULTISPECIES: YebG family protein [Alishewanella]MCB5226881.1 YebG family protein [Alishewanella maricola]MDP5035403.1 YebG family protein [Alishewanella sp.]MDP5187844.1 YebG family protein [Alishewanella sp.]MDP5457956.1 YebG family protein [Alishewanella sp. SMS8]